MIARKEALKKPAKKPISKCKKCRTLKNPDIITINIGGQEVVETLRSVLTSIPNTGLEAKFSGRIPYDLDSKGRVFVDRDAGPFKMVLSYLRTGGKFMPMDENPDTLLLFKLELDYWGIKCQEID